MHGSWGLRACGWGGKEGYEPRRGGGDRCSRERSTWSDGHVSGGCVCGAYGVWALRLVEWTQGARPRRAKSASCGRREGSPGAEWDRAGRKGEEHAWAVSRVTSAHACDHGCCLASPLAWHEAPPWIAEICRGYYVPGACRDRPEEVDGGLSKHGAPASKHRLQVCKGSQVALSGIRARTGCSFG